MIFTELKDLREQVRMTDKMEKAIQFLSRGDLGDLADGRIEVDGEQVYALVQTVATKAMDGMIEVEGHKKYIDIHYLPAGREVIGWAYAEGLEAPGSYNEVKDQWKASLLAEKVTMVQLSAGMAMVCYPSDAHAPRLLEAAGEKLRKIVMKVAV